MGAESQQDFEFELDKKYYAQKLEKDLKELNAKIDKDPENIDSLLRRSFVYQQKGQFDLSIKDCEKAIKLDPKLGNSYYSLAVAYEKSGSPSKALENYHKTISVINKYHFDRNKQLGDQKMKIGGMDSNYKAKTYRDEIDLSIIGIVEDAIKHIQETMSKDQK